MDLNVTQKQILSEYMRLNPNVSKEKATQLLFGQNSQTDGNVTLSNGNYSISFTNFGNKKIAYESLFGSDTTSQKSKLQQYGESIFKFFDKNDDGVIKDDNTDGVNEMQLMLSYIQTYAGTDGNLNADEALKMIKDIDTSLDNSGAVSDLEKASAAELLGFVKAVDGVKEDVTTHPQTVASTSAVPTYEDFTTEEIQLMAVQTLKEEVQTSMGLYNSFKSGAVSDLFGDDDDPLSKRNQYYRRYWSEKTRCEALELAQAGMLTEVDYRKMQIELIQDYLSLEPDNPNLQWAEQQAAQLLEQSLLTMDTKDLTRLVVNLTELSEANFEQAVTSYKLPYIKEAEKRQNNDNLPTDVALGSEPLKIPFSEEAYQQSYSRNMDFGEVWGLEFAEKFNPQDMVNFHYKKSECMIIAAADQRLSPIINQLQEYINNPHTRGIDDNQITTLLLEAQGILGISSQQDGGAYSQAVSEFDDTTPTINLDGVNYPQDSGHYAYHVNSDLLNQAKNMLGLLQAKYDSILGDKTLEQYQNELTATYKEAFGDFESGDDLINLANTYVQDKQETLDNVKVGVNIFGGALVIAGTLVTGGTAGPILMGSGIALSVAGSPGVSALEGATREGGLTKEDIEAIKQELTQNALLTAAGMGIGKVSGNVYQALVLKNMCPRLVALATEIGIDATASLLADLVITGQIDLTGEGISQLVNLLVGVIHSKGDFNHFLDTHAGNIVNTDATPEQSLATIMESNPNVRDYASRNSGDSPISQEITTYLEQNPQYGQEIVDYMSIQRRRPNDTTNPTEHLGTYIQTLYEFPQHKEFITALANDPNLDGQAIRNIITERGNNLTDQLKSDILLIASKGHDTQGINFYLRIFEQNPEFRANFTAEVPQFVLIDNSTPTAKVQKQRNTIISKINNTCPQALQTLKQTLGEDYFNKIKWEDIIPENATAKEITKTIEYLNDCSKFFSRISTNEERYGKNLVWAHSMNVISENAQIKIANGGNFDEVIYGIANEYRFYDVSTTLDSNHIPNDGTDRRLSSGKDRSTNPDYYRSSTSFNQDNYGNYFERFMSVNSQEIEMPYDDIKKTFILPLDKDSGGMIHPDPSTIRASMKHAADAYNNLQPIIQKAQSGQKLSADEIQQFHNNAAEIYYLVAHAMPWERGSNGIADIFMRSIYSSANIDLPALKPGVSLDLEAFCVDLKTYQQNWLNFFE